MEAEKERERERKHKCTNKNIVIVHNYIILFYCDFELGRYFLLDFNFSASTPFGSFAMVFIFVFVIFPDRCSWFSFFFLLFVSCVCAPFVQFIANIVCGNHSSKFTSRCSGTHGRSNGVATKLAERSNAVCYIFNNSLLKQTDSSFGLCSRTCPVCFLSSRQSSVMLLLLISFYLL